MTYKRALVLAGLLLSSLFAFATIFGTVSGLIHDPQHRPVQGAQVTLHAANSAWTKSVSSNDSGEFRFDSVPLGEYSLTVELAGFAREEQGYHHCQRQCNRPDVDAETEERHADHADHE